MSQKTYIPSGEMPPSSQIGATFEALAATIAARREAGELAVTALWPEAGVRFGAGRLQRLEAELDRLARFTGCPTVTYADGWLREPVPAGAAAIG